MKECYCILNSKGRVLGDKNGTMYGFLDVLAAFYVLDQKGVEEDVSVILFSKEELKESFYPKRRKIKLMDFWGGTMTSKIFSLNGD